MRKLVWKKSKIDPLVTYLFQLMYGVEVDFEVDGERKSIEEIMREEEGKFKRVDKAVRPAILTE